MTRAPWEIQAEHHGQGCALTTTAISKLKQAQARQTRRGDRPPPYAFRSPYRQWISK